MLIARHMHGSTLHREWIFTHYYLKSVTSSLIVYRLYTPPELVDVIYSTCTPGHASASSFCTTPFWETQGSLPMARWWTKPPIIVAALGVFVVIMTVLLPRTTITQHTSGSGSPAIGSAGRDITITQQPTAPLPLGQSPATAPSQLSPPPAAPVPPGQPWWQQPPVIAAVIAAIATLVAALLSRARASSPAETEARRPRRKA